MKNLQTKLTLIFVLLMASSTVFAARNMRNVRLSGELGMNVASMSHHSTRLGYRAGVGADYAFNFRWHLITSLQFTVKGGEYHFRTKEGAPASIKKEPVYIQLPIHAGYRVHITDNLRVMVTAGPYIACGIAGNSKTVTKEYQIVGNGSNNMLIEGYTSKEKVFGSKDSQAKRFDAGIGLSAGVELFDLWIAKAGYDWGLVNIAREGNSVRNRNWYFCLGMLF